MTALQIQLFGPPKIHQQQEPVTGFVSSKATALIYYLAATNRTHSRDSLAALFWADVPDARAKKNLRDILSNLRKVVGPALAVTRQIVALTISPDAVDVTQFEAYLKEAEASSASSQLAEKLKAAADLQSGEFLEGFYVSDAPLFEAWVLTERERFGQLALQVFNGLVAESMHAGNVLEGIDYALRSLALEPLEEATHRQLMTMYAANGQYAAALEQYEHLCQLLYDELGAAPSGETTDLFDRIQARQENPAAHQITADHLQTFVGRTQELTELSRLLARSECRLITLVGLGGVGKSRLAIQVAIQNAHHFLDGTYLVSVGTDRSMGRSLEQFATDIASTVGLTLSGDEDIVQQLLDFLRTKSMLMLIDNAEGLLESPEANAMAQKASTNRSIFPASSEPLSLLGMIAGAAPNTKLIATSREHLGLRSEWVFDVNGLSTPAVLVNPRVNIDSASGDASSKTLRSGALQSDAVQLFLKRARQAWVDFTPEDKNLTQSDLVAIGYICQLVDGIPLAIELAAGWVSMLSCREIMQEVMAGTDLLASSARDLPVRHRSMHAIFDHSWQLLSLAEQNVVKKLALFQGGFSRLAAQQIANATLPVLQSLMQRSLLSRSGKERFGIHNLLQQYALQKLREDPEERWSAQERHARYFGHLLSQHQVALLSEQAEAISTITHQEMDNLRAAYDWSLANNQIGLLNQMLDGLYHIYSFRNWLTEGITRFHRTAEILRHQQEAHAIDDSVDPLEKAQTHILLGRVTIRLGQFFQMLGRYTEAQNHLAEGFKWANQADDILEKGLCLLGQANAHYGRSEYRGAAEASQQSLAIYQQAANPIGVARALYSLGKTQLATGEYRLARQNISQALSLAHASQLQSTSADCLGVLGQICWNQGDHAAAQSYLEEALATLRFSPITNKLSEARVLNELGFVAWSQGLHEQAQTYHTQARQTFHAIGNQPGEGNTLSHLGRVAERRRAYAEAARLYGQALTINQAIQDRQGEATSSANLAFLAFRQANYPLAYEYFTQCHILSHTIGFRRYEAIALACLGLLNCFGGDYARGEELARAAIALAQQIQDPIVEAYGWVHLGYALSGEATWPEAAAAYSQGLALRRNTKIGDRLLDPLSGLAFVALQKNDFDAAHFYTNEIIAQLDDRDEVDALLPAQVYYVCFAVLEQSGAPDAAHYLQKAQEALGKEITLESDQPTLPAPALAINEKSSYRNEPLVYSKVISSS